MTYHVYRNCMYGNIIYTSKQRNPWSSHRSLLLLTSNLAIRHVLRKLHSRINLTTYFLRIHPNVILSSCPLCKWPFSKSFPPSISVYFFYLLRSRSGFQPIVIWVNYLIRTQWPVSVTKFWLYTLLRFVLTALFPVCKYSSENGHCYKENYNERMSCEGILNWPLHFF
jgi:hypothetical protein